jgi:hypothetical protein
MEQEDQGIMTYFEAEAHSFVLRIWRENREDPDAPAEWRGWIEHVQSEQRHYFRKLGDIPGIVSSYVGDAADLENQVFMPIQPKSAEK